MSRAGRPPLPLTPAERLIFVSGATEANNLALKGVVLEASPARRRWSRP